MDKEPSVEKRLPATVVISRDSRELGERVAVCLAARSLEKPKTCIGLAVGATPALCYSQFASMAIRGTADLTKCHFLVMDEFYGSEDLSPAPHYQELDRALFRAAAVSDRQISRPSPGLTPKEACSAFSEMAAVRPPDVLVMGLQPGGKIGWNSNNTPKDKSVHVVDMTDATEAQNKGYSSCVTLGPKQFMAAKEVWILAVARNKAQLVKEILEDRSGSSMASWLVHNHPRCMIFIDSKAASSLPQMVAKHSPSFIKGYRILGDASAYQGKKIICFSPHPDDTSISAGAALALLSGDNDVTSCCCTTGHRAFIPDTTSEDRTRIREEEATAEARQLGAKAKFLRLPLYDRGSVMSEQDLQIMIDYITEEQPDLIFLPHTGDTHPTHRAILLTILQALTHILTVDQTLSFELFMYEGPWSLFPPGSYNTIVSPPAECFAKKLAAIRSHISQTDRTPYDKAADALAQLRSALVPEQDLGGFGENPPHLEDRLELFFHCIASSPLDVQRLISLFDEERAPSTKDLRSSAA